MKTEKAYKLLSIQEKISNKSAKDLIDRGLVFVANKKLSLARAELPLSSNFKIMQVKKPQIIFENNDFLVIDKAYSFTSEQIQKMFKFELLHRLDKETSGVLVLCKNEEIRLKAIEEFKKHRVKKTYLAVVNGKFIEEMTIEKPILTIKTNNKAISKISNNGKEAITKVSPLMVIGNLSLVKVQIITGRTHQIRVHLSSISHPVLGDEKYGIKPYKRLMLHSYEMSLFEYNFKAELPKEFKELGFLV